MSVTGRSWACTSATRIGCVGFSSAPAQNAFRLRQNYLGNFPASAGRKPRDRSPRLCRLEPMEIAPGLSGPVAAPAFWLANLAVCASVLRRSEEPHEPLSRDRRGRSRRPFGGRIPRVRPRGRSRGRRPAPPRLQRHDRSAPRVGRHGDRLLRGSPLEKTAERLRRRLAGGDASNRAGRTPPWPDERIHRNDELPDARVRSYLLARPVTRSPRERDSRSGPLLGLLADGGVFARTEIREDVVVPANDQPHGGQSSLPRKRRDCVPELARRQHSRDTRR